MKDVILGILWLSLVFCLVGFWVALWLSLVKFVVGSIRQMWRESRLARIDGGEPTHGHAAEAYGADSPLTANAARIDGGEKPNG